MAVKLFLLTILIFDLVIRHIPWIFTATSITIPGECFMFTETQSYSIATNGTWGYETSETGK